MVGQILETICANALSKKLKSNCHYLGLERHPAR